MAELCLNKIGKKMTKLELFKIQYPSVARNTYHQLQAPRETRFLIADQTRLHQTSINIMGLILGSLSLLMLWIGYYYLESETRSQFIQIVDAARPFVFIAGI